ncbi:Asp-tRNA(Asn)/Glu-tRNA(Gln) amidotransferase subunit GatB [bacterium]|nr:Asp-tRNA(Asn)/Glu-tRNA(Gln) amidotransferase subunit GatB [bacterium]
MSYEIVIGLETHTELHTRSKVFCRCDAGFGGEPNSHVCPVCLGLPGTLPVLNRRSLELALLTALALECEIPARFQFDRKNYYYPDLPKNYQISQEYQPLGRNGRLLLVMPDGREKSVRIHNVHLEEDAGKLLHEGGGALVDLNRAGTSLLEIVSYPDIASLAELDVYMATMRQLLRYVGASDCKMQEGSLRFEVNISLRPAGATQLGTKVELKNIGSMKAAMRAAGYEIERQREALEAGREIVQETRLWDEERGVTAPMRSKEGAKDYRYFPEPDLVPVEVDAAWLEALRRSLPEPATARRRRFVAQYGLPDYDAGVLTADRQVADWFEAAVAGRTDQAKTISNWVMTHILKELPGEDDRIEDLKVKPEHLAQLAELVSSGAISGNQAKEVLLLVIESGQPPAEIVEARGMKQLSDASLLEKFVEDVIAANPKQVEQYRAGKEAVLGYLVGQVMKASKGQANPKLVNELLRSRL